MGMGIVDVVAMAVIFGHVVALAVQNKWFNSGRHHTGRAWDHWHIVNRIVLCLVPCGWMLDRGFPWWWFAATAAVAWLLWQAVVPWRSWLLRWGRE